MKTKVDVNAWLLPLSRVTLLQCYIRTWLHGTLVPLEAEFDSYYIWTQTVVQSNPQCRLDLVGLSAPSCTALVISVSFFAVYWYFTPLPLFPVWLSTAGVNPTLTLQHLVYSRWCPSFMESKHSSPPHSTWVHHPLSFMSASCRRLPCLFLSLFIYDSTITSVFVVCGCIAMLLQT